MDNFILFICAIYILLLFVLFALIFKQKKEKRADPNNKKLNVSSVRSAQNKSQNVNNINHIPDSFSSVEKIDNEGDVCEFYENTSDVFVGLFVLRILHNLRTFPYDISKAYIKEIILFMVVNQFLVFSKEKELLGSAHEVGVMITNHIMQFEKSDSNLERSERIFNERLCVYRRVLGSPKQYEYLYRFCQWTELHGHENATQSNNVPNIDFGNMNSVVDDFVYINALKEHLQNINLEDLDEICKGFAKLIGFNIYATQKNLKH